MYVLLIHEDEEVWRISETHLWEVAHSWPVDNISYICKVGLFWKSHVQWNELTCLWYSILFWPHPKVKMVGILKNNENGRSPRESNIEQDFIKETIEWFQKTRKWTGFQIYADTHQQTMSDIDPLMMTLLVLLSWQLPSRNPNYGMVMKFQKIELTPSYGETSVNYKRNWKC